MRNKKTLFLIIGLASIAILLLILALTSLSSSSTPIPLEQISPTKSVSRVVSPTPSPIAQAPVIYNQSGSEKMLQSLKERETLSENDTRVKKVLIYPLAGKSGIIHSHSDYIISYLQAADVIQVEILSENVSLAKNEAVTWLTSQGLSQKSICTLPVVFYLNYTVAQTLKNTNIEFNPISDACL